MGNRSEGQNASSSLAATILAYPFTSKHPPTHSHPLVGANGGNHRRKGYPFARFALAVRVQTGDEGLVWEVRS
jgi:hypothetical protein